MMYGFLNKSPIDTPIVTEPKNTVITNSLSENKDSDEINLDKSDNACFEDAAA